MAKQAQLHSLAINQAGDAACLCAVLQEQFWWGGVQEKILLRLENTHGWQTLSKNADGNFHLLVYKVAAEGDYYTITLYVMWIWGKQGW